MRITDLACLSAALFLCAAAPAHADWQFTKWRMTEAQVLAAGGGKIKRLTDAEAKANSTADGGMIAKLAMEYTAGEFQFRVYFRFDASNRLGQVDLELKSGEGIDLERQLTLKYGNPVRKQTIADAHFRSETWVQEGDQIEFVAVDSLFSVLYVPRLNENTKGL